MRIGGGVANGRTLRTLPGRAVRPTSGRVRQALFNILRNAMGDVIFVDLFAGTGSVGLEALSHGARHVYLVEHDPQALHTLHTNVRHCDASAAVTVIAAPLPRAARRLPKNLQADMLFLDPPYASDLGEITLAALHGSGVVAPQGMVIWQHSTQRAVPSDVLQLPLWQSRRYGNTQLSFYTHHGVHP
jgi:16S rRNA (guanine966-N2)-methyltransferase